MPPHGQQSPNIKEIITPIGVWFYATQRNISNNPVAVDNDCAIQHHATNATFDFGHKNGFSLKNNGQPNGLVFSANNRTIQNLINVTPRQACTHSLPGCLLRN
jgi:hypothetical protein